MAKTPAWWQGKPRSYKLTNWDGVCVSCGREWVAAAFNKGSAGHCNRCSKKKWETANPIKLRAQRLYGNAQKRAKEIGWPPLDFDSIWIENKIRAGSCEVTGIKFDLTSVMCASTHAKNPWVPSLDRIDSSLPYLKSNVQLVVFMYNVCKGEFTHNEVREFCKALARKEILDA